MDIRVKKAITNIEIVKTGMRTENEELSQKEGCDDIIKHIDTLIDLLTDTQGLIGAEDVII